MKIIAWNINGLRAIDRKTILDAYLTTHDPDIFCMGETKLSLPDDKVQATMSKFQQYPYRYYATSKGKKGYSGTAMWSKLKPLQVHYGIDPAILKGPDVKELSDDQKLIIDNNEGRLIALEFKKLFVVHCYVPNAGETLQRLPYRVKQWDTLFQRYIAHLQDLKPTIVCGDFNCAHTELDIHAPKRNLKSAGFTIQERNSFAKYLNDLNLVDIYRTHHPKEIKYTYWSYRGGARKNNKGWRIDYFLLSKQLQKKVKQVDIHDDQHGSDHAPIALQLAIRM